MSNGSQECLADIELSLKNGYKVELQPKLLLRRVECYIELKQRHKAKDSLVIASKHARLVMSEEQWGAVIARAVCIAAKFVDQMGTICSISGNVLEANVVFSQQSE
ncbi:unnamed protein product [Leptidea sinapis]|uniref:Uncharacterized protein n=1 Tax=Leptidea sinapis TaxID=189913 RepID=A0A5E4QA57_9NEOP|nr:unnamed protein product [Leptidea sinapis]